METVLSGVGNILHCVGFNNNQFIDNLSCTEKVQLKCIKLINKIRRLLRVSDL